MKMSRAEKIEYVSSKQNDYTLSCDINSCQFTRRAGGAGYSCVLRLKVSISDARDSTAAALISREFISDIKKTAIRPNRERCLSGSSGYFNGAFDGLLFK